MIRRRRAVLALLMLGAGCLLFAVEPGHYECSILCRGCEVNGENCRNVDPLGLCCGGCDFTPFPGAPTTFEQCCYPDTCHVVI
jgi:hypothetical protein